MGGELIRTIPVAACGLYVEAPLGAGLRVEVDEGQAHYLVHVMRAKPGGPGPSLYLTGATGSGQARDRRG